jgi:hypothetical protein
MSEGVRLCPKCPLSVLSQLSEVSAADRTDKADKKDKKDSGQVRTRRTLCVFDRLFPDSPTFS